MKRVKYNRADIESTINAAKKIIQDKPLYVFATYLGYTIDTRKLPFGQRYIEVNK
jgi:hypothetical protein